MKCKGGGERSPGAGALDLEDEAESDPELLSDLQIRITQQHGDFKLT